MTCAFPATPALAADSDSAAAADATSSSSTGSASSANVSSISGMNATIELSRDEQNERYSTADLGITAGTLAEQQLNSDYPDANVHIFQSETDTVTALASGKIEYGFVTEFFARRFVEQNPGYQYITPAYLDSSDSIGLAKGNDELREKINQVLKGFREDGTLEAVKQKWEVDRNYTMDDVPVNTTGEILRAATTGTNEPYTFILDGKDAGESIELTMRIAYELGYRVEFLDMAFSSEITSIVTGKADIGLTLTPTDERREQIDFTDEYITSSFVALVKSEDAGSASFLDVMRDNFTSTFIAENRWQLILSGLATTCMIACGSFVLGTLGGGLLTAMRRSPNAHLRRIAQVYARLATGIPALVWLMVLYYVAFTSTDISALATAVICFGLLNSAALAEVFVTGLNGVDKGQMEAATAMGFSRTEAYRRIILPQAAKSVWPLYAGQFTSLVKETSIVGYIALQDLTKVSDIIRSRTFQAFFPLLATAAIYFAVIALSAWALERIGRRLEPRRRKPEAILKGIEPRPEA